MDVTPRLLAIGGAHIDRRGRVCGDYVPAASNPGAMREEVGGGAFNALRNAIACGVQGSLFSVRGGDAAGLRVAQEAADWRIADLSVTFLDRATPSYTAILDREGDLVAGLADMALYDLALGRQMRRRSLRDAVAACDAVLCDANMPADGIERLARLSDKPIHAIAVSPAKVVRLTGVLPELACLFMNRREAAVVADVGTDNVNDLAQGLAALGLRAAVITSGNGEVTIMQGRGVLAVDVPEVGAVVDVTGAGDALAGAAIAAIMRGADLPAAVREGVARATLTVESDRAVARIAASDMARRLAQVPQPRRISR